MLSAVLALACWLLYRALRKEPRRLVIGAVLVAMGYFILAAVVEAASAVFPALVSGLGLLLVLLAPASVYVLAGILVWNGLKMVRKEGRSIGNSLSLLTGLFLFLAPPAAIIAWVVLSDWKKPLTAFTVLVLLGAAHLGLTFLTFYVFTRFYARLVPAPDPGAVVVLGSGLVRNQVPPLLRARLDRGRAAFDAARARGSRTLLIPTGGKGTDESRPEGIAMAEYLRESGVAPDDI